MPEPEERVVWHVVVWTCADVDAGPKAEPSARGDPSSMASLYASFQAGALLSNRVTATA